MLQMQKDDVKIEEFGWCEGYVTEFWMTTAEFTDFQVYLLKFLIFGDFS